MLTNWGSQKIRKTFLDYFANHGHQIVPSSSLIPAGDTTLLFANAGMNQFKDVFLGREVRPYSRAASCQKCVRAGGKHNDLDNVGYTGRHHTFFEMLGNFSFGDYFKEEAIRFAWELVTQVFGLPVERLWFTVYQEDEESAKLWRAVGAPSERILRFGEKENFWSMGETGPCGPCTEIHYFQGPNLADNRPELVNGPEDVTLEIWNLVFMQYDRDASGHLHPLPKPCVDTGAGLERLAAVLQGVTSNYDTDLFAPILRRIQELAQRDYERDSELGPAFRVIADHARSTTLLLADGVIPSNEGRGYVLRRIIRRALRYGRRLGFDGVFLVDVVPAVVESLKDVYPELVQRAGVIQELLRSEEERFARTLNVGTDLIGKELERLKRAGSSVFPGETAFRFYETYGLPVEVMEEFAQEEGLTFDRGGFEARLEEVRKAGQESWKGELAARSREEYELLVEKGVTSEFVGYEELEVASATILSLLGSSGEVDILSGEGEVILDRTPFYAEAGGQVGDQGVLAWKGGKARVVDTQRPIAGLVVHKVVVEQGSLRRGQRVRAEVHLGRRLDTQANHTATHLLHAALRRILGPTVQQAGSLVAPDRLRFDFSWGAPLLQEQIEALETLVNADIRANYPVEWTCMQLEEAKALGAMALFGEKYGEVVRVVSVGGGSVSRELCGGCHVRRTGEIGAFKIVAERGIAAGVRRIEAVTGREAMQLFQQYHRLLRQLATEAHVNLEKLPDAWRALETKVSELQDQVKEMKLRLAAGDLGEGAEKIIEISGVKLLVRQAPAMDAKSLRTLADRLRDKLKSGVVVVGMAEASAATLLVSVTEDVAHRVSAVEVARRLAERMDANGGGKPTMAQAGGKHPEKLPHALAAAPQVLKELIG
ncbi:MAG: alanine--tRNA ligase [Thermoanaerobaculaceae bacterium]